MSASCVHVEQGDGGFHRCCFGRVVTVLSVLYCAVLYLGFGCGFEVEM